MAKAKRKTKATTVKAKKSKKKIAAKPAKRATARPKHKFTVSHHREEDFDHGLRPYSAYRDLGIAPATGGMVQAHVIRMTKPFTAEEVAIPHYHDVDFQMVYVLKGWFRSEFEGQGAHTFHAGSCWIQPPRIKHTVLGYSDDCELASFGGRESAEARSAKAEGGRRKAEGGGQQILPEHLFDVRFRGQSGHSLGVLSGSDPSRSVQRFRSARTAPGGASVAPA